MLLTDEGLILEMSKKRKYYDLAEERALTTTIVMWRFCAYKSKKDYESGDHYFVKEFLDHTEMKVFSGEHSAKEKPLYPDYCSMYWKIETNTAYSHKTLKMKKYWIIENEMYSTYDTHTISNLFYGTWYEAARECIKNIGVNGDNRSVKELKFNHKKSDCITNNYL